MYRRLWMYGIAYNGHDRSSTDRFSIAYLSSASTSYEPVHRSVIRSRKLIHAVALKAHSSRNYQKVQL